MKSYETDINCYIDDPLMVSVAGSPEEHTKHLLCYTGLWHSLGLDVSWKEVARGRSLQWIGFQLTVTGTQMLDLRVELAEAKKQKLLAVFNQLDSYRGVMPSHLLPFAAGVLGWLSSAIPAARPLGLGCLCCGPSLQGTKNRRRPLLDDGKGFILYLPNKSPMF